MPANAILAATGASTCALGSHMWTRYKGLFTMKPKVRVSPRYLTRGGWSQARKGDKASRDNRRGNEAKTV